MVVVVSLVVVVVVVVIVIVIVVVAEDEVAVDGVAIGVDDLDGTLAKLEAEHGITPERPPYQVSEGGSRICFVRDPDGYRIELIERSDY